MATTVIKVQAAVGQTEVTLTANGGSGTASNPYTLTRIAGTLCSISVPEALTGNWHCVDGAGLETLIYDLVDEAVTIELGNVPTAENISDRLEREGGPIDSVPKYGDSQQRDKTSASSSQLVETVTKVEE